MLAIPHYAFNYAIDNWSAGTPVAATEGTAITLGNSDAKGTATDLLGTTLAADCYCVQVSLHGTASTGVDTSALVDILYDPAGGTAWSVLIPNLLAGFATATNNSFARAPTYFFPLYVPKGATIGAQGQTTRTSGTNTCRVIIELRGGASRPGYWYGTKVTDIGTVTASSAGLDHTVGSTGTYSAWTSIGGTSAPAFGFLAIGVQGSSATHNAAAPNQMRYGFGSTKLPGAEVRFGVDAAEQVTYGAPVHPGTYCSIPAGTQLQISGTAVGATTETFSVALYGVS